MKKHLRIALIVALAVCACLLITVIVVISGGGLSGGNKNCRYPYSWKLKIDGSVDFSVKACTVDGFGWIAEEQPEHSGIAVSQLGESFGKNKFNIQPFSGGTNTLMLKCVNNRQQIEMSLSVMFVTEEDGTVTYVSVIESDFNLDTKGEAEGCQYSIYTFDEGGLEIRFKYADGVSYAWKNADDGSKGLRVYYPFEEETDLFRISVLEENENIQQTPPQEPVDEPQAPQSIPPSEPQAPQSPLPSELLPQQAAQPRTFTAQLYGVDSSAKQDLVFTIEFEYINGKASKVLSHTVEAVAHKTQEDILAQKKQEAENHVGKKINDIENASNWQFILYGSEEEQNKATFANFDLEEKSYSLSILKDKSIGKPNEGKDTTIKAVEDDKAAKPPYSVYANESIKIVYWQTDDGLICWLTSEISNSTEKLIELADKLIS